MHQISAYIEWLIASTAASWPRKSFTATSLFSFFLSRKTTTKIVSCLHDRKWAQTNLKKIAISCEQILGNPRIKYTISKNSIKVFSHKSEFQRASQSSKNRRISANLWGGSSLMSLKCLYSGSSAQTAMILSSFSPCITMVIRLAGQTNKITKQDWSKLNGVETKQIHASSHRKVTNTWSIIGIRPIARARRKHPGRTGSYIQEYVIRTPL